jgi:hypothetical protein
VIASSAKREQRRSILSIDRGSSSLKVAVFDVSSEDEQLLIDGEVEAIAAFLLAKRDELSVTVLRLLPSSRAFGNLTCTSRR